MSPAEPIYALKADEKVGPGFVRVLKKVETRIRQLRKSEGAAEDLHEVRLLIKRLRALLWFAKPALSPELFAKGKSNLRNASHLLSDRRDLTASRLTLSALSKTAKSQSHRNAVAQTTQLLFSNKPGDVVEREKDRGAYLRAIDFSLGAIREMKRASALAKVWPLPADRVEKAFRSTRKAGRKARRVGSAADFHDWRKKAKRLLYELQLTAPSLGQKVARTIKRVDKLQDRLGCYHDYVVVEEKLQRLPPSSSQKAAHHTLGLLQEEKHQLRKKARKLAKRLPG